MYYLLILILLTILILSYHVFIKSPRVMIIKKLSIQTQSKQSIKIAFFSDVHFTTDNFDYRSKNILTTIKKINPDMIIFGGDLMDKQWLDDTLLLKVAAFLKALQAPLGTYGVCGNHDISFIKVNTFLAFLEACGIQALHNQVINIPNTDIMIGGVADGLLGKPDLELFKERLQPLQILVCHEPDLIDKMNIKDIDLMLSGHTHGGQIRIPLLYKLVLPKLGKKYIKGKYLINKCTLLVSSGIGGALFSGRFLNPPEILEIHLQKKDH